MTNCPFGLKSHHLTQPMAPIPTALKRLAEHALVIILILAVFRATFVLFFVQWQIFDGQQSVLSRMVFNALRFDLQVTAYAVALPSLLSLAVSARPMRQWEVAVARFRKWYFAVVETLVVALGCVDLGFYANFQSHINIVFFDFFNEGPIGLLQTVWEEYHCLWYGFALVVTAWLLFVVAQRIERCPMPVSRRWQQAWWIPFLLVLAVCMRGSVWRFPLQIEDTFVSDNKTINDIVPNAPYMLKKALKEKRDAFKLRSASDVLAQYGFISLGQALEIYTKGAVSVERGDTMAALRRALFVRAPRKAMPLKPNVVIIYGESWSNYLFELDGPGCDMYMGLRKHFDADLLFRRFQSVQNGTIASIENLTVATPFPRFFASKYRLAQLPTSLALPFKSCGYDTEFMSGMDMAWENSAEALARQGFDRIYDKFHILRDDPQARYNSVGVYDEHLFDALLRQMGEKRAKPMMTVVMTTTNHPPFEFPEHLRLPPIAADTYKKSCFAERDRKVLGKYLTGFRYYNRALARFLDRFKASKAADNTILVITGDHNVRSILNYEVVDRRWQYSVPLYIYLPPALRRAAYGRLTDRWGSHDDILPTLAPFALGGAEYMRMGNNLLDTAAADHSYYSYNVERLLAENASVDELRRYVNARNALREVYFQLLLRQWDRRAVE